MKCKLTWPETTFTVLEIAYGFDGPSEKNVRHQ